jgi:type II secretory pathway pseudopilin PulG
MAIMKSKQRGITLMETVAALAIASMMLVGLAAMTDTAMEDSKGQQASFYQAQVVAAARKYINANYADLLSKTPNTTTVVALGLGDLKGVLPDKFSPVNAYGQATCVLVRQPTAGSAVTPKRLDALVVTAGGQKIEDRIIAFVAANAGQGSGYIKASDTTTAEGASWRMATNEYRNVACPGGSGTPVLSGGAADGGHLVSGIFYDGPGQLSTDFLYRNEIPGRPDLNTMNTPIRIADKAIAAEGDDCKIVPVGAALPVPTAAIGADKDNNLLRCGNDGKWTAVTTWKSPVENFGALPATDKRGDVRMTMDRGRAYMYNGSTWAALAVDQFGDLNVERDVIVGRDLRAGQDVRASRDVFGRDFNATRNVLAGNDVNAARDVTAGRDVRAAHDIAADHDVIAARDVTASNNVTASKEVRGIDTVRGGYITSDTVVETPELYLTSAKKAGDTCHIPTVVNGQTLFIWPIGTVVRDPGALLLVCAADKRFRYPNGTFNP